jgi:hypothetical protein
MSGGKRSDLISPRDLEVLDFIARFGVVPRYAVAKWADTARTVTECRERRLRNENLIRVLRGYGQIGPISVATSLGLKACARRELRPARLSLAALTHDTVVAEFAAAAERAGHSLLSEREILARERAIGDSALSASLPNGSVHRADLVGLDEGGEPETAIEIELSTKGAARLDQLMRAWRRAVLDGRVSAVQYHCAPRTLSYLRRAIERTKTESLISAQELRVSSRSRLGFAASLP